MGLASIENNVDVLKFVEDVKGYNLVDVYVKHSVDIPNIVDEEEWGRDGPSYDNYDVVEVDNDVEGEKDKDLEHNEVDDEGDKDKDFEHNEVDDECDKDKNSKHNEVEDESGNNAEDSIYFN
ncbi:unnamed protein product [Vicia faba]|uniref:Uncharacterized protein n=1 Tax=Vicia faba TaxID=3906 RepID=A0AAV0ZRM7_VICFA|nr:unnamed protein product [Vicia faba]